MTYMKLSRITWEQLQVEMSTTGNPDKITQLGRNIEALIMAGIDATNRAELTNAELMLKRLMAALSPNMQETVTIGRESFRVEYSAGYYDGFDCVTQLNHTNNYIWIGNYPPETYYSFPNEVVCVWRKKINL